MNELTLFWGSRNDAAFQWRASNDEASETTIKPLYQLESHEILKADLASLAEMAVNSKVTLVLSCSDVICAHLQVPNKAQKLLRKAIPYMMEDEVASLLGVDGRAKESVGWKKQWPTVRHQECVG